jgi:autotransporter-associated beta strand protein
VVNGNPAIAYNNATESSLMFARNSAADGSGTWSVITVDHANTTGTFCSLAVVDGNPAISYRLAGSLSDLRYVRALDANGTSWGAPVTVHATGNTGVHANLKVINGRPAISYTTEDTYDLLYVRANDITGQSWGTPMIVQSTGTISYTSMEVVDGNPAICYHDNTLRYVRATDADGTAWGTPISLDSSAIVGVTPSLKVIAGQPAVSYYDFTNQNLKYIRANDTTGTSWGTAQTLDSVGSVGQYGSLMVVNGQPAISYYDFTNSDLKYIRATDATGSSWGTAVALDTSSSTGQFTSLVVISGSPAISYYDLTDTSLKYIRASDSDGAAWAAASTVDPGTQGGNTGRYSSMAVVDGRPAISYYDSSNLDLRYIRANDAAGTSWGAAMTLDSTGNVGQFTSLAVVSGNPAISYYDGSTLDLKYVRANDAAGTSWGTPLILDSTGTVGQYSSLAIIDGHPAISYYDITNTNLKYVRANDAAGTSWGTPLTLDSVGTVGQFTSLAVVNGNPAISYYDFTNTNLKYVRATDVSGTTWGVPVTVDASTADVGLQPSLVVVNGKPSMSYFDTTNDKILYVRASDASGTSWNDPLIIGSGGAGPSGLYRSALAVVLGSPAVAFYNFSLQYVRAYDSDGTSWPAPVIWDGEGNTGYEPSLVVVDGQPAVSYGDNTNTNLMYARSSSVVQEIALEQPAGTNLPDGGSRDFGSVLVGAAASMSFTIRNTGTGILGGVALTQDGAHSGDFTVTSGPLPGSVSAGESVVFTVQFSPSVDGTRTAALHIASDDADENPFDILLSGSGTNTLTATYSTGAEVPLVTGGFSATGKSVSLTLDFAPAPGTDLLLVDNTGPSPIAGEFTNIGEGQALGLSFGGTLYVFTPTYLGGTGNDLVLRGNRTPLAVADAAATPPGITRTISAAALLANDSPGAAFEAATQTLTITGISSASTQGGTLALSGGVITYTPPAAFTGTDSFNYTINDGAGGSATATVTLSVDGVAPVVLEDSTLTFHAPATITNPVTLSGTGGFDTNQPITLSGTVTVTGTPVIQTSSTLTITAPISGTGQLEKKGSGTLNLMADSSFSGGFKAMDGIVGVGHDSALGTGTIFLGGATIRSLNEAKTLINRIVLAANTAFEGERIVLPGALTIRGLNRTITTIGDVDMDGVIDNDDVRIASGLIKRGAGTLKLGGDNLFSGGFSAVEGTVAISRSKSFGKGTLSLEGGSIETRADAVELINQIVMQANTLFTGKNLTAKGSFKVKGTPALNLEGDLNLDGEISPQGAGSKLRKKGSRKLTMGKRSKRDIELEIEEGEVVSRGRSKKNMKAKGAKLADLRGAALRSASKAKKNRGKSMGGGKKIKGNKRIGRGGSLGTGNSPGILETEENLILEADSIIEWEISDATGTAGAHWDYHVIGTTLDITATPEEPVLLEIISLQADHTAGLAAHFNPYVAQSWPLFTTGAGITGFDPAHFVIDVSEFAHALHGGSFSLAVSGNVLNIVYTPGALQSPEIVVEQPVSTSLVSSVSSVDFGTVAGGGGTATRTFTLRNTGADPLTGLAIGNSSIITGGTEVIVTPAAPGATTLSSGQSTTFDVTVTNNQATAAPIAASILILSNDGDENPFTVMLTANGAATPQAQIQIVKDAGAVTLVDGVTSVDFGSSGTGSTTEIAFTITNTGTAPLTGLNYVLDGAQRDEFTVVESPDEALPPGASAALVIEFAPEGGGARTAALHLYSNDPAVPAFDIPLNGMGDLLPEIAVAVGGTDLTDGDVTGVSFGLVSVNAHQDIVFTITNLGGAALTGLVLTQDGTDAAQFPVQAALAADPLASGASTSFTIRFAPTSAGIKTAALHLASNDSSEPVFDILLNGEGAVGPEIVVEQAGGGIATNSSLDFGEILRGSSSVSFTVTVRNTGSADLTGLQLMLGGAGAADYAVSPLSGAPLAGPAGSASFTIQFTPGASGERAAQLSIQSNDTDEQPFDLLLRGIGRPVISGWSGTYFGAATSGTGFSDDFDSDGISNLLEFAYGTDPTVISSSELSMSGTYAAATFGTAGKPVNKLEPSTYGVDFRYVFTRRADYATSGLTYIPEFSSDLGTWHASGSIPTVLATSGGVQLVSVPYPHFLPNGKKARFARLRVTITP